LGRNPPIASGKVHPGASARVDLHDIMGMHEIEELEQRFFIPEQLETKYGRGRSTTAMIQAQFLLYKPYI
jgi:hypothetical protein